MTAWFIARQDGEVASGPEFNSALAFILRVDYLVYHVAEDFNLRVGGWLAFPPWVDIVTIVLLLALGTLQWWLLGSLVSLVASRWGQPAALGLLGLYGLWFVWALLAWVLWWWL